MLETVNLMAGGFPHRYFDFAKVKTFTFHYSQDAFQELQLDLLDAGADQDPLQERGARLRRLQEDPRLLEELT